MIDVDTSWMAASTRKLFEEAVHAYAEAVRRGAVPAMQSADQLMRKASQAQIMAEEGFGASKAVDPEI